MPTKKRKLTDGYVGEQSENPPKSVSNAPLQDVGGKPKPREMSKAETMIGGYDLKGGSKTESLPRTIEMQKTHEVAEEALERMRKRNKKP